MNHETAVIATKAIINSLEEQERIKYCKVMGIKHLELEEPKKRKCFREFTALKILSQAEKNRNKN